MTERESETRRERIDPRLEAAGWRVAESAAMTPDTSLWPTALPELPTNDGPADYALCVAQRIHAVVEAKKLTVGPQGVLTQAERYSRGIQQDPRYQGEYGVPFLYSTNGEQIRFHDVRREHNRSRWVAGFHTPQALAEMLSRDLDGELAALDQLVQNERVRPYQVEANTAIEQAVREGKRKMLVTMATGAGKTLMTVNEIYRLMKSGVARRVLFLVDRRALAAQTVRSFASYEAEPGLKFDKIYPVYSQRFQQADLGDEPFDPTVMPNTLLTAPKLWEQKVSAAFDWLIANGLLVRDSSQSSDNWVMPSELAEKMLAAPDSRRFLEAHKLLAITLHPRLETWVRQMFMSGEVEAAVFMAVKEVEVAVREAGGFGKDLIGVKLMAAAFKPGEGPLHDPDIPTGEQAGLMARYTGLIGALKNPSSHRQVDFDDPAEAVEVVLFADLLLRMLDRSRQRES